MRYGKYIGYSGVVLVVASAAISGAVATEQSVSSPQLTEVERTGIPLRILLITPDVSFFACFAALSGLGMASTRGPTARSCHLMQLEMVKTELGNGRPSCKMI